jgi:hypothetical protein
VVLAAVLLPWTPEIVAALNANRGTSQLVAGAGVVFLAYVLGVVFDRLADTLTDWLERRQRLLFVEYLVSTGRPSEWSHDPFPENELRMHVLNIGGGLGAWVDYHRSRMRIARALAVYMPFVTWSLAIGLIRLHHRPRPSLHLMWPAALALFVVVVAAHLLNERLKVPRTDAPAQTRRAFLARHPTLWPHPAIWCGSALVVAAITVTAYIEWARPVLGGRVIVPTFAAGLLAAASGWAWWRISWTFREYLLLAGRRSERRPFRPE